MERDERNRRISELRGYREVQEHEHRTLYSGDEIVSCGYDDQWRFAPDWHADANWPTLLREMLRDGWCVDMELFPGGLLVIVKRHRKEIQTLVASNDPADHICEAYLKWKQGPGGEV